MARMTFKAGDEYALKLSRLAAQTEEVAKKAIYAAANIVADKVASNLAALPPDTFRHLKDGEKFVGLPETQKRDLQDSFGVTPIKRDDNGWNTHIGFEGYGSIPTEKYPKGVPNQLLARSVESGSSVRQKTPFSRPAVNATKQAAIDAMARVIDEELEKIVGGK